MVQWRHPVLNFMLRFRQQWNVYEEHGGSNDIENHVMILKNIGMEVKKLLFISRLIQFPQQETLS